MSALGHSSISMLIVECPLLLESSHSTLVAYLPHVEDWQITLLVL